VTSNIHHAHLKAYANLGSNVWLSIHLIILPFCIISNIFFLTLHTNLGLLRSITIDLFHWFEAYKLDGDMSLPLFPWVGTHVTYDVIKDAFVFTIKNVEFHVSREQTHILLSSSLQFLYQ
jgi:hypothetical protein